MKLFTLAHALRFSTSYTRCGLHAMQQTRFQCGSEQKGWNPFPPIGFTEATNLDDAVNTNLSYLDGHDNPAFVDEVTGSSGSRYTHMPNRLPLMLGLPS